MHCAIRFKAASKEQDYAQSDFTILKLWKGRNKEKLPLVALSWGTGEENSEVY